MADIYTKFPEGIDTFEDNADLDSGHAAAAAQYTKYLADGIIKAADINHVKHAITALEQHYAGAVNYIIDGKFDPDMMIHEYSYSYSGGTHTLTCKSGSSYSNAANGKAYFTTAFSDGQRHDKQRLLRYRKAGRWCDWCRAVGDFSVRYEEKHCKFY